MKKTPKNADKFICENCDFKCNKQSDWTRHINRPKHIREQNNDKKTPKNAIFTCKNCAKEYKNYSGLWKHSKTCTVDIIISSTENTYNTENITPNENIILPEFNINDIKLLTNLVLEVVKSNGELQKQTHEMQKQMMELYKQGNNNATINSNNHSNNKTFNLNFFLNEQCKDAMNIMDFVDTFQLQFDDLERIGEVGYVEGISNLIIDKLNGMDIYKRPIHCSDAKREIMHIKDNGVWEKDNENNDKLRLAIKHITKKNIDLIGSWTEKYPGVRYSDHRLNDKFNEIIMEAMGGKNNKTMKEGEGKIIKKISKMVLINKNI